MACTGRYAQAWQYAAFWCEQTLITGLHDGAGPADAALSDQMVNFLSGGVRPAVGMEAFNVTKGTSGRITAVTEHSVTATGVTWAAGDHYRIVTIDARQKAAIEFALDITAGNLRVALAATGACDCAMAGWAVEYLAKLNILEAGLLKQCPCGGPKLTVEERQQLLDWYGGEVDKIRDGRLDVCAGATGADFPAVDWAEQSVTEFAAARIIADRQ